MALLLGNIDADTIWIIGRWHSKEMLHYLHIMARPLIQGHATTMVASGGYTLVPPATFQPSYVRKPAR